VKRGLNNLHALGFEDRCAGYLARPFRNLVY
jgi:hypothetical protein